MESTVSDLDVQFHHNRLLGSNQPVVRVGHGRLILVGVEFHIFFSMLRDVVPATQVGIRLCNSVLQGPVQTLP